MKTYYNEFDANAAGWLRNLAAAGEISDGTIDERSIKEVRATELDGVRRAHFFAGIGGWDLALRLAGWPEDREVWTGSCPCQPFSVAGKQKQYDDERDLWPEFFRLIKECRPATVIGEQVDSKHGRKWLSRLRTDLESSGYAVGYASLNSASIGAHQIRQRLYWVANAAGARGCGGVAVEKWRREEFRRPSAYLLPESRPDHRGSSSTLAVSEVCTASYGVPSRVGALRGYGNAIDPEVAAQFIMAFMESR